MSIPPTLKLPVAVWALAVLAFMVSLLVVPSGGRDWREDIAPGSRRWWDAPWEEGLALPPYGALLLWPLGILPTGIGSALNAACAVIVYALVARKLGGPAWAGPLVLATYPGSYIIRNGQIDWLPLLGMLVAGGWEAPLLVLKPQVALWVLAPRLREAGRNVWRWVIPGASVLTLSLLVWDLWPISMISSFSSLFTASHNVALWPVTIPLGLYLVFYAVYRRQEWPALVASPFLFPYVNIQTYTVPLLVLAAKWPRTALAVWAACTISMVIVIAM